MKIAHGGLPSRKDLSRKVLNLKIAKASAENIHLELLISLKEKADEGLLSPCHFHQAFLLIDT